MPRGVVAVAASGGRDSASLLHATLASAAGLDLAVACLHVHHGLMPEADAWADGLEAYCRALSEGGRALRFFHERLRGAPASGDSVEAWARRERYAALARLAKAAGASIVLLGHHRADQAETVLLQALRGAGAAGLAAMPKVVERDGLTWARPWLEIRSPSIAAYAAACQIPSVVDPSNADPRFARSRLRAAVMPALAAAFPQAQEALVAVARQAHDARALHDEVAAEDLLRLTGTATPDGLPLPGWRALSHARRVNLLRAWLALRCGRGMPDTLVRRLLAEAADDRPRRWPLPGGRWLRSWRGTLSVVDDLAEDAPAGGGPAGVSITGCANVSIAGWTGTLEILEARAGGLDPTRAMRLQARVRSGGERFLSHRGGIARSLKKQFQSAGVAPEARDGPLLFDASGALLFVPGLGVDARAWAPDGVPQWRLRWCPHRALPSR